MDGKTRGNGAKDKGIKCSLSVVFSLLAFGSAFVNIQFASHYVHVVGDGCDSLQTIASSSAKAGHCTKAVPRRSPSPPPRPRHPYNFTIGICAIVKDGEPYLTEWLDYHLDALRLDWVYLYDNSPRDDLATWYNNTRSHPLYVRVEVRPSRDVHDSRRQKRAYTDCVLRFGRRVDPAAVRFNRDVIGMAAPDRALPWDAGADYLALIDLDEFLVPRGRFASVHQVMAEYAEPFPAAAALAVNWMLYGSANRTLYAPLPVLRRFRYRDPVAEPVIKTIVRASRFYAVKSPHSVDVVAGGAVHTTSRPGAMLFANVSRSGASDPAAPSDVLLLNHYRYTSAKEYHYKKCVRRDTDGDKGCSHRTGQPMTAEELRAAGLPTHIAPRAGNTFDDSAWRLLRERVPKYRVFDDEAAWGDYT